MFYVVFLLGFCGFNLFLILNLIYMSILLFYIQYRNVVPLYTGFIELVIHANVNFNFYKALI